MSTIIEDLVTDIKIRFEIIIMVKGIYLTGFIRLMLCCELFLSNKNENTILLSLNVHTVLFDLLKHKFTFFK